ncbi:hypothetical protein BKA62DRAFT_22641 [Auriculariales sp. MPI-PUGE-AT-0066]|nr:hypothetical protein BKA62DRAFT_22641 [Auriculariales sp. MPI-PUGE-AT-0066]
MLAAIVTSNLSFIQRFRSSIMLSIPISFGSHVAYSVPSLSLTGAAHQLQVDFKEGEHVFTSPDLELGTIHAINDAPLIGRLSFRYTYGMEGGVGSITVCDADYESADGMTLMTFPKDREDSSCFERASSAGFAADEIHRNGYWNTRSPLMPGASQIFRDMARDASRAVIAALEMQNVILNVRRMLPELPVEVYHKLCLVHVDGEFLCSYDELNQHEIKGKLEIWDIFSSFGGTTTFPTGTQFANVLGSTPDKKVKGKSWIALWNATFGPPAAAQCSSLGYPKDSAGNPFACNAGAANQVGGHVILGTTAQTRPPGSNDVRIIPICKKHNNVNYTRDMLPVTEHRAVVLTNYLN